MNKREKKKIDDRIWRCNRKASTQIHRRKRTEDEELLGKFLNIVWEKKSMKFEVEQSQN